MIMQMILGRFSIVSFSIFSVSFVGSFSCFPISSRKTCFRLQFNFFPFPIFSFFLGIKSFSSLCNVLFCIQMKIELDWSEARGWVKCEEGHRANVLMTCLIVHLGSVRNYSAPSSSVDDDSNVRSRWRDSTM